MSALRSRKWLDWKALVCCAVVLLAAQSCGGGGGGAATPPTPTSTVPLRPTATLPPTAVPSDTPTPTLVPSATPQPPDTPEPTATDTPQPTATPEPTATPTATPLIGPVVVTFGVAEASGSFGVPSGTDDQGRAIFPRQTGTGFVLYVEGRVGSSGLPIATNLLSSIRDNPVGQPDLQIVSSRPLGDGSLTVCDRNFPEPGGVPAVDPPDFAFEQSLSDALNDFACRFRIFPETDFACTQDNNGVLGFANRSAELQFCTLIGDAVAFPRGDTVLTVRLRDSAGRAGPARQIVVRVSGSE